MSHKRKRATVAAGLLAAVVGLALASGATGARSVVIGASNPTPEPNCPTPDRPVVEDDEVCQVSGHVTGFQRSANGRKGLFRVRENGKIVAWSVDLSRPSAEERQTLGQAAATKSFGNNPTAGISILRRTKGDKFRLIRRSPMVEMQSFYGEKPVIALNTPLKVRQGQIVAMTTSTWLPNFAAHNVPNNAVWIGSRTQRDFPDPNPDDNFPKECAVPDSVPPAKRTKYFFDNSAPQRKVGKERKYGCEYRGARLLYWAYLAPSG